MIGQHLGQRRLVLGLEQGVDGAGRQGGEGGVGRREDGERARALQRVDQAGGLDRGDQGGVVLRVDGVVDDVLVRQYIGAPPTVTWAMARDGRGGEDEGEGERGKFDAISWRSPWRWVESAECIGRTRRLRDSQRPSPMALTPALAWRMRIGPPFGPLIRLKFARPLGTMRDAALRRPAMADHRQDKNLPASQRKLDKAARDGQVARSRDLGHFAAIARRRRRCWWRCRRRRRLRCSSMLAARAALRRARRCATRRPWPSGSAEARDAGCWSSLPFGARDDGRGRSPARVAIGGWTWTFKPLTPEFEQAQPAHRHRPRCSPSSSSSTR